MLLYRIASFSHNKYPVWKQTINGSIFTEGIGYISPEYAPESVEVPFYAGNARFTWQIPRDNVPANR
jgi:hypothetical protein